VGQRRIGLERGQAAGEPVEGGDDGGCGRREADRVGFELRPIDVEARPDALDVGPVGLARCPTSSNDRVAASSTAEYGP
jgi:hypothetical protein